MPGSTFRPDTDGLSTGAATEDPVSERKFVTILRADIVGSTDLVAQLEPEQAVSRLEPALTAMRAAVHLLGGVISKEMGDGLVAVFGAPVADDNHASLACHAALELVRRVAALGDPAIQVRVGLHSGFAVMYVVSNRFSRIYEIGGAASHMAARLEAAAGPGEIYASDACRNLAEGHVRFEDLGHKTLKGFPHPVPVYRVATAGNPSRWEVRRTRSVARFVGRTPEMAVLQQGARSAPATGCTVCVTGDPGIGKSRLVHEFVQALGVEGWRLVEAGGHPNLQTAPFALLKTLLQSLLASPSQAGPTAYVDPRDSLPRILRSAIDAVLELPVPDDEWHGLEPQRRGQAISDASRALIVKAVGRERTVLLIEDVHWVDRASFPVVAAIASMQHPNLLVLITTRPESPLSWRSQRNAEVIALRPLDASAGKAMLDDIMGISPTTHALKTRIIRHTANVPLFVEEVCRRLKETGVLVGQWGDLSSEQPVDDLGIPASVQDVIAARLDRLSRQQRRIVQAAAALGERSTPASLGVVTALSATLLDSELEALDRAELLVTVEAAAEKSLEFPHDMIRQVAYDSMIGTVREDVHFRILAALEGEEAWRQEADRLCHHATRAKAWAKAVSYGRDVARKCVARSAFADAATYYEIAIDAVDKVPHSRPRDNEAIDLRIEARMAFMGSGRIAEWFDLGKEAERRANVIDDLGRRVAAMTVRAAAQNFHGTPMEAIDIGKQVVELAQQWGDAGWLNLAEYGLGQACFIAGHYLEADASLTRACARLTGPQAAAPIGTTADYLLLMCCMVNSVVNTNLGNRDKAEHLRVRAREIADQSERPFDRVVAALGDASWALDRGDPAAAAIILDEAFELAERHGVRMFIPAVGCYRGIAYLELERFGEANEILAAARQASQDIGYKSTELRAGMHLARLAGRDGAIGEALDMLGSVTNAAQQQGFSGIEAEARLFQATIAPVVDSESRAVVVHHLRTSFAISSRNGAQPLALKAQALLSRLVTDEENVRLA